MVKFTLASILQSYLFSVPDDYSSDCGMLVLL